MFYSDASIGEQASPPVNILKALTEPQSHRVFLFEQIFFIRIKTDRNKAYVF